MTPEFKKGFTVVKKVITKPTARFLYNYFLLKREISKFLHANKWPYLHESTHGKFGDDQVPNTYAHYSDITFETLLLAVQPKLEKATGLKLYPNYTYARIYKNGDILHRHKDRFSCEISTTLFLGGDPWPIYIAENKKRNTKGVKVNLSQGDMLVYRGNILEHWREPFEGKDCAQVFLHYNNVATKGSEKNKYDRRPYIGLPNEYQGVE